jgi:hypothetical protein
LCTETYYMWKHEKKVIVTRYMPRRSKTQNEWSLVPSEQNKQPVNREIKLWILIVNKLSAFWNRWWFTLSSSHSKNMLETELPTLRKVCRKSKKKTFFKKKKLVIWFWITGPQKNFGHSLGLKVDPTLRSRSCGFGILQRPLFTPVAHGGTTGTKLGALGKQSKI